MLTVHHAGQPGQELKQEQKQSPWRRVADWLTLLGCLFSHFPYIAHRGLAHPMYVSNQENGPTDMPTGQSDGGSSAAEGPSSQLCQVDNQDEPSQTFLHHSFPILFRFQLLGAEFLAVMLRLFCISHLFMYFFVFM